MSITQSIVISQLNPDTFIFGSDFFPLVNSSSLTTYRTDFNSVKTLFNLPQISCSWSSQSISSSYALSASYPPYPETSMSWASQSISNSYSITASWAPHSPQIFYTSMSWASQSLSSSYALSASYADFIFQPSCSWTSQSISSSYSLSASYVSRSSNVTNYSLFTYVSSQNVQSIVTQSSTYINLEFTTSISRSNFPYQNGIILSCYYTETSIRTIPLPLAGGNIFVSSSITPIYSICGQSHGTSMSTTYVNVNSSINKLYFSSSQYLLNGTTFSTFMPNINIIGYY